jgi:hypothetical protein
MVGSVNETNIIIHDPESKLLRSLLLPVSDTKQEFKVSIAKDNFKINPAKIVKDPAIAENKIKFTENNSQRPAASTEGTISHPVIPDLLKRAEPSGKNQPISILKKTITDVTSKDPILKEIDINDQGTIALTSSILSAINVPEIEPIKLTLNVLTTDAKKEDLKRQIQDRDYEGITRTSVSFTKSYWGSIVSGAKFADIVTETGKDFGLIAAGRVVTLGKVTGSIANFANKLALPFSVVGTGLSAWDLKNEYSELKEKNITLSAIKQNSPKRHANVIGRIDDKQETRIKKEITDTKVNLALKGVGTFLSGVSTYAMIVSISSPAKAYVATPVSLATGVIGSITSSIADEKVRANLSTKMKILKKRYLD